eukprot:CAMPEP_0194251068 /NCGR_PEP_ID=MMETSP0158-20130606/24499_1 /TAXON_ID=33649 /ORGANISM="Thalassionema nitzschioides, Strain L26-B" /LENGTH=479 /DNA_ID=CAMNT_0038988081 /DNA_START=245 /DNA_END=1681 /DNA_ORIENTATION=+
MDVKECDIVIIGCGIAGLSAGLRLLELDPSCRIGFIEARNRVGGRTETQNIGISSESTAFPVDVGGQWLGPMHKEMLSLVAWLGVELLEQEYPDAPIPTTASRLVECAYYSFPSLPPEAEDDVQQFNVFLRDSVEKMDPTRPFQYPEAKRLDALSAAEVVDAFISSVHGREEIYFYLQSILAVSPSSCSWLFFLFYVSSGGGVEALGDGEQGAQKYKIKGGAGRISQLVLEKLSSMKDVQTPLFHFRYAVRLIEQSVDDSSASDRVGHNDYQVAVTAVSTLDENTHQIQYFTRRVIVAVPFTICTRELTFSPPLPECKIALGRKIRPGGVFKVVVCYPQGTVFGFGICRALKDLGFVHNIFASNVGNYPSLVGLITGPAAEGFKKLDDSAKKTAVISQYASMYSLEVRPVACVIRDWTNSEKYSGGCFAGVFPPTSDATFASNFKALKTPFGRIHFAGTETSEHFYGYMEGARLSGLRT